jgi:hypothetical protein
MFDAVARHMHRRYIPQPFPSDRLLGGALCSWANPEIAEIPMIFGNCRFVLCPCAAHAHAHTRTHTRARARTRTHISPERVAWSARTLMFFVSLPLCCTAAREALSLQGWDRVCLVLHREGRSSANGFGLARWRRARTFSNASVARTGLCRRHQRRRHRLHLGARLDLSVVHVETLKDATAIVLIIGVCPSTTRSAGVNASSSASGVTRTLRQSPSWPAATMSDLLNSYTLPLSGKLLTNCGLLLANYEKALDNELGQAPSSGLDVA